MLLYEEGGQIKFPLIRRAEYAGIHSGQISLPGGKTEAGETPVETALRETEEEVGIPRHSPKVLGALTNFLVIPSNYIITPIIATLDGIPSFHADTREVAAILSCSLNALLDEESIREAEILVSGKHRLRAPHFEVEKHIVWGATAMMLNELRLVLLEVLNESEK
jgi:8-oxo-dGTP pyrophosphatase MutT (NUDIX family)